MLVTAVVTAGVHGNAACAGDPASWRETESRLGKDCAGRRNDQYELLVNHSLTARSLGTRGR